MNTYLKTLFDRYNISEKNRYEILQLFSLLPDNKKQNLLNNFHSLSISLNKIEEDIEIEKNILVGNAIKRMEDMVSMKIKENTIDTREERANLKKEIID